MTSKHLYLRREGGSPERLEAQPFENESALQQLLAEHPDLIDGSAISPDDEPRRWLVVGREIGIGETPEEGNRWALDLLLLDQDAVPTLIEVKLAQNKEARRQVVAQMLDYAAHCVNWTGDYLEQKFNEYHGNRAKQILQDFLAKDDESDSFWQRTGENLADRNLRLLFAADRIPDTLVRIVKFLNAQMRDNIEVIALEIPRFQGNSSETFVPKVIGQLQTVSNRRPRRERLTRQTFLEQFDDFKVREATERLFKVADRKGVSFSWGPSGVSIRVLSPLWQTPVTVAWLFAPGKPGWMRTRDFSFGNATLDRDDIPDRLRTTMALWAGQFEDDKFAQNVSGKGVAAYAVGYEDAVKHLEVLEKRLARVLDELERS